MAQGLQLPNARDKKDLDNQCRQSGYDHVGEHFERGPKSAHSVDIAKETSETHLANPGSSGRTTD
jgi:hypothetical protein